MDRPVRFIDLEAPNVDALLDSLAAEPRLALDTESDSFHRYFEKVCLIQLSSPRADWFFDPLAFGMPPRIAALLSGEDRLLVVHGAENDVRTLRRTFGLTLGRLFDTGLAAAILGAPSLGLKALLEAELGVIIEKSEQRSDWGRRPLTSAQLEYARQDTRWLLPLADRLAERLELAGRRAWLDEDCERLRYRTFAERTFDSEGWRRLKGSKELGAKGRRLLSGAYLWREETARARDRPPFRIMNDELLLRLAMQLERGLELGAMHFVPKWIDQTSLRQALLEALDRPDPGTTSSCQTNADRAPKASLSNEAEVRVRLERLKKVRGEVAAALGLDPGFLVSLSVLDRLARAPARDLLHLGELSGLSRWRVETLGPGLLRALHA